MRLFIYQCILHLAIPILFILSIQQTIKRQGGVKFILQRFGLGLPRLTKTDYWFHCASVGEVITASPLIEHILSTHPNKQVLVTCNTPSGKKVLQSRLPQTITHCYLPYDLRWPTKVFLKRCRIRQSFIIETEIWPYLYQACHRQGIPITIINARLSHKTLRAPFFIHKLYQSSLQDVTVLSQSEQQTQHYQQLAQQAIDTETVGNIKWAIPTPNIIENKRIRHISDRPYIALISSHHDEEIFIASCIKSIQANLLTVIIPRHPERSQSLQRELAAANLHTAVRSQQHNITAATEVYLADTLGEVTHLIADAEICIIGGSFIPHGGQNFLEAAALKKPIICGPSMHNFSDLVTHWKKHNGILQTNREKLAETLTYIIENPAKREALSEHAYQCHQDNQDIISRYLDKLNIR